MMFKFGHHKPSDIVSNRCFMIEFSLSDNCWKKNGAWCNGSTPDFESVDLGSNPGAPAKDVCIMMALYNNDNVQSFPFYVHFVPFLSIVTLIQNIIMHFICYYYWDVIDGMISCERRF